MSEMTEVAVSSHRRDLEEPSIKVSFGAQKPSMRAASSSADLQILQAENLRMAQQRIIELEKDVEKLRKENELLSSASEIAKQKTDEFYAKVQSLEKVKIDLKEMNEAEIQIFRESLQNKDQERQRLRIKIEELDKSRPCRMKAPTLARPA